MTRPENPDAEAAETDLRSMLNAPQSTAATAALGAEGIESALDSSPVTRFRKRYTTAYLAAVFTIYLAWIAPIAFTLAIRIEGIDPVGKNAALALAIGIPGILVLITGPLVGVLSDRTRSRLGRRRPWLLLGAALGVVGSVGVGIASTIPVLILSWTIAYVGYTMCQGMLITHLGDRLPEDQRGRVAGLTGALQQIAPIMGVAVAGAFVEMPLAMFVIPGVIALVGTLTFALAMKDSAAAAQVKERIDLQRLLRGFYFNPRRHPNLGWVWISRAFMFLALSFQQVYSVYLIAERLSLEPAAIAALVSTAGLGSVLTSILGAVVCGWLSDRLRSRKPFLLLSAVILSGAILVTATMTTIPQYYLGALLGTFAIGVYGAVDQATALDVLPVGEDQNGRYMGIVNLANQAPQAVGPFLAAAIVGAADGNYAAVYFVAAGVAVVSGLLILPLKLVRSERTESIRTAR